MEPKAATPVFALLTLYVLLLTPFSTAGEIYRWIDEKGHVRYGDNPPAQVTAEKIPEPPPASAPIVTEEGISLPESSTDAFSTWATLKRLEFKRQRQRGEEELKKIDGRLAQLQEARQRNERVMGSLDLPPGVRPPSLPSEEEKELADRREIVQQGVQAVDREFARLREETMKRYGSLPGWWIDHLK